MLFNVIKRYYHMSKTLLTFSVAFLLILTLSFIPKLHLQNINQNLDSVIQANSAYAASTYVIPIRGTVEHGLLAFIKRGIAEADQMNAELLIIDINTFGGRVDAAIEISKLLRNQKRKVISYVSENAWSAGALLALSTQKIYMGKGSSIGSAEPKNMDTWTTDEKMISALRAEFQSVAESMGHPKDLAIAMVDKDFESADYEIKVLKPKGKLLNLTAEQAVKFKLAKGEIAGSIEEVIQKEKVKEGYVTLEETIGDKVARFVSDPVISGILLNIGILGITIELWMPGHIAPGLVGIVCFVLFFWGHTIAGAGSLLPLFLFLIGAILVAIEIFVIPGFGIVGLAGIVSLFSGVYLVFPDPHEAIITVSISLILTTVLLGIFITYFPYSKMFKQVTLSTVNSSSGVNENNLKYAGRTGIAITDLNPAGKIEIGDAKLQVVSDGEFITKGTTVKVISDEGNVLTVTKIS